MHHLPLVSIIIPSFNAAKFVAEAIESSQQQTFRHIEIIVVDDASVDATVDIVRGFQGVRLIQQVHAGAAAARNRGVSEARGQFIKFLDADDLLVPGSIEKQVEHALALDGHEITYGNFATFNASGQSPFGNVRLAASDAVSVAKGELLISSPLYQKSHLIEIGGFDTRLRRGQEWNLNVRLAGVGKRFRYHPVDVFIYRDHDGETRISTLAKEPRYTIAARFDQLMHTFDALNACPDPRVDEFFAGEFWFLGRFALRNDDLSSAEKCFAKAVSVSPCRHLSRQPVSYRVLEKLCGPRLAEKLWVALRSIWRPGG